MSPRPPPRHPAPGPPQAAVPPQGPASRQATGERGETVACDHLRRQGLTILARNWRLTAGELRGEIDIVALDRGVAVFVEVKTRRGDSLGGPLHAVTPRKQRRIRALAAAFLRESRVAAREVRFDVVGVWLPAGAPPRVEHVVGAF